MYSNEFLELAQRHFGLSHLESPDIDPVQVTFSR